MRAAAVEQHRAEPGRDVVADDLRRQHRHVEVLAHLGDPVAAGRSRRAPRVAGGSPPRARRAARAAARSRARTLDERDVARPDVARDVDRAARATSARAPRPRAARRPEAALAAARRERAAVRPTIETSVSNTSAANRSGRRSRLRNSRIGSPSWRPCVADASAQERMRDVPAAAPARRGSGRCRCATAVRGSSASITGQPGGLAEQDVEVARAARRRPSCTMPLSTMSAASSGGVRSSAIFTASTIALTGSCERLAAPRRT